MKVEGMTACDDRQAQGTGSCITNATFPQIVGETAGFPATKLTLAFSTQRTGASLHASQVASDNWLNNAFSSKPWARALRPSPRKLGPARTSSLIQRPGASSW